VTSSIHFNASLFVCSTPPTAWFPVAANFKNWYAMEADHKAEGDPANQLGRLGPPRDVPLEDGCRGDYSKGEEGGKDSGMKCNVGASCAQARVRESC